MLDKKIRGIMNEWKFLAVKIKKKKRISHRSSIYFWNVCFPSIVEVLQDFWLVYLTITHMWELISMA